MVNIVCFLLSAVYVCSLFVVAALSEKKVSFSDKLKVYIDKGVSRIVSDLFCFLIILTPHILSAYGYEFSMDLAIIISMVLSNTVARFIYKYLGQQPDSEKYKYDVHGFILAIAFIFALFSVLEVSLTMIVLLLGFYIDFDLTDIKNKLYSLLKDVFPKTLKSCGLILVSAVVFIAINAIIAGHWIAVVLPWIIGAVCGLIYLFIMRNRKSTNHNSIHRIKEKAELYLPVSRDALLNQITEFMHESSIFEGLLQIGSGAIGFTDIYSDIDLMAGCYDTDCVKDADQQLYRFFTELGACHIEKRAWTSTVLGLSVYFEDGLSADISFMPTSELPIRSPQYKIVFAKTENFTDMVNAGAQRFAERSQRYGLDDSVHYRFINELRYVEIALLREQFVFADISLGNARKLLLSVETVAEGKKLHQFKAYNTLPQTFLNRLEKTYPRSRTREDMHTAKENMLALYLETVKGSDYLTFDDGLLKLLGCFG